MDALVGCKKYAGKSVRGPLFGIILSGDEKTVELCELSQNCTGSMMNPYTDEIFGILKSQH